MTASASAPQARFPYEIFRTDMVEGKPTEIYTGFGSDSEIVAQDMRDELLEAMTGDHALIDIFVRPNPALVVGEAANSSPLGLTEHALAVLAEECAEVIQCAATIQQLACKALRFGLDDGYPGADTTSRQNLVREFNDLVGAMEHLQENTPLAGLFDREQIEAKKQRIKHWHAHAIAKGTLATGGSELK